MKKTFLFLSIAAATCALQARTAAEIDVMLRAKVLPRSEWRGYSSAYARLAKADRAADDAWIAAAGTPGFDARRQELRDRAIAAIGGFPARTPLNARVTGVIRRDGYRIEKLLVESRPGFHVTGHVYIPDSPSFKPPYAAVLIPCGHTDTGKMGVLYQHSGVVCARAGFIGLVFDPIGQGERHQRPRHKYCGFTHNACGALGTLIGESTLRVRLWDCIRMFDYLETRPDVDASRLGAMGVSGGGTMTAMIAAFEPRVKAVAPACYISSLRRVVDWCGPQDSEQNIFGQLAWGLNHAGLLLLRYPLPALVCASHDDFFPFDGTLDTMRVLNGVSGKTGAAGRYALVESSGKHGWYASMFSASTDWMRRWLYGDTTVREPDSAALRLLDVAHPKESLGLDTQLTEKEGLVTAAGEVLDLPGSRSVFQVIADDFAGMVRSRPAMSAEQRAATAVRMSGMRSRSEAAWTPVKVSETNSGDVAFTRLAFVSTDGDAVPAALLVPQTVSSAPVLFAGDRERREWTEQAVAALAEGRPVMVLDVEGCGEVGVTKKRIHVSTCSEDGLGKVHYLLGESLVGRRAEQLRAASDFLADRFRVRPGFVSGGMIAIPAAHAVASDSSLFTSVRMERAPRSWSGAIRDSLSEPLQWMFSDTVHGALKFYDWPDLLEGVSRK